MAQQILRLARTASMGRCAARIAAAAAALALFSGCGSSVQLLSDWGDPELTTAPRQKAMVISVKKDAIDRRIWEDAFVAALAKRKIEAVPSYSLWSHGYPDSSTVRQVAREQGFDTVIISIKTAKREETRLIPGTSYYEATSGGYWDAWGRYQTAYRLVETPPYTETDELLLYRTDIWVATPGSKGGRLAWSGFVEARNPGSVAKLGPLVADRAVRAAAKKKIL